MIKYIKYSDTSYTWTHYILFQIFNNTIQAIFAFKMTIARFYGRTNWQWYSPFSRSFFYGIYLMIAKQIEAPAYT